MYNAIAYCAMSRSHNPSESFPETRLIQISGVYLNVREGSTMHSLFPPEVPFGGRLLHFNFVFPFNVCGKKKLTVLVSVYCRIPCFPLEPGSDMYHRFQSCALLSNAQKPARAQG